MADIDVVPKPGPTEKPVGQYSTILMIVAILAVVGLMGWLAYESSRRAPLAVQEEARPRQAGADEVPFATVATALPEYEGRTVTISEMPIGATLGPRVFWTDVPGNDPFLLEVPEGLAGGEGVAVGQTVTATGSVVPIDQAIIDQWVQAGAIDEGSREVAELATHYMLVSDVLVAAPTQQQP
jgi:hypothetical protein